MRIITPPHRTPSRVCTLADMDRVMALRDEMKELCRKPFGHHTGALAIAHCQVEATDPLRFFVRKNGDVIINPKILSKEGNFRSLEGCMSHPFRESKVVLRAEKIVVEYSLITGDSDEMVQKGEVLDANETIFALVMQHEIQHFQGKTIFNP